MDAYNNNQVSTTSSGLAVEQQIQGDDKMKVNQQITIPFVSTKTDEQQSEGGEDVITEAQSILLYLRCVVEELDSDINKHKVTTPSYINQKVALISELAEEYSTAVWNENTDLSKAITLGDE